MTALDVNGDGLVDHRDAIEAAKLVGPAAAGIGATALASTVTSSFFVETGATALASTVATAAFSTARPFISGTLRAATSARQASGTLGRDESGVEGKPSELPLYDELSQSSGRK